MSKTAGLFVTRIHRDEIANAGVLNHQLETIALGLSRDDRTGLAWSRQHGYPGYTSYESIDDLAGLFPAFARLERIIRRHALIYARELHWDLRGTRPVCDGLWVTISATFNALYQLADKAIPKNAGCYRPIHVIARPGSRLNVRSGCFAGFSWMFPSKSAKPRCWTG